MPEQQKAPTKRFSPGRVVRRFVPRPPGQRPIPKRRWLAGPRFANGRFSPLDRKSPPLGRLGALEVRLANRASEVRRAQHIRYHVFYEEMSAVPDPFTMATRRDRDAYDRVCDHLLVLDHDAARQGFGRKKPAIVGTYRLLRQEVAAVHRGFYSAGEFKVGELIARHPGKRFLELGRSCVLKPYRNKRTIELLWHGIWSYVHAHKIDVMIGCASLEGTDPDRLALELSFLHHHCRAPDAWRVEPVDRRRVSMDRMPASAIDQKAALRALPPLVKGYLRLGGVVSDGAVVDRQFGTTDILIVLPVERISERYINHYGADASRYAVTR